MPVVVQHAIPISLPRHWRRTKNYRAYRAQIASAHTFQDILAILETQLATPTGRLYLAGDFEPAARFARRFLRTTALVSHRDPVLSRRAVKILTQLWTDATVQRSRTPVSRADLTREQAMHILAMKAAWTEAIAPLWKAAWPDRVLFLRTLESATVFSPFTWSDEHRAAMRRLLRRGHVRPVHVVTQMTAWVLRVSVRRVRAAGHAHAWDDDQILHA